MVARSTSMLSYSTLSVVLRSYNVDGYSLTSNDSITVGHPAVFLINN